jgi:hypothetical protein
VSRGTLRVAKFRKIQLATVVITVALCCAVDATATTIAPGSASQVAALVKAAPKIKSVPKNTVPTLAEAEWNQAEIVTPALNACIQTSSGTTNANPCLFGDKTGKKTMVLWGDSHAEMWFPAINAIAKQEKWKLVVLLDDACPIADVSTVIVDTYIPNTDCPIWRANMLKRINALDPSLVVMSESWYPTLASGASMTTATWQQGVETTLGDLDSHGTKRALIGDTIFSTTKPLDPDACVSQHPSNIQLCDVKDTTTLASERQADATAAAAKATLYVNEDPWECSSVCTPIVSHFFVYWSAGHITVDYSLYLTKVMKTALQSVL